MVRTGCCSYSVHKQILKEAAEKKFKNWVIEHSSFKTSQSDWRFCVCLWLLCVHEQSLSLRNFHTLIQWEGAPANFIEILFWVAKYKAWKTMKWTGSLVMIKQGLTRHIVLEYSCQIEHQQTYQLFIWWQCTWEFVQFRRQ